MEKDKKKKQTSTEESTKAETVETAEETASEQSDAETIKKLEEELAQVKDQLLRLMAEYDNFRKRSVKERENAYLFSKSDVIEKLLPVIDNFERAAMNETASLEDYKKGVTMIYTQFTEILKNLGVEAFGEKGDAFDPNIHSAVMHAEDDSMGENEISDVFQKGYRLGEKILRPATVKVVN